LQRRTLAAALRVGTHKRCSACVSTRTGYGIVVAGTHSSDGFCASIVSGPNWLLTRRPSTLPYFGRLVYFTW
jgi:hypothetical protein